MVLKGVDIVLILVYFGILMALGIVANRKTKGSEDYFVAGKKQGTFSIAAMWLSSWIGGASIIGASTDGYIYGISGGWYVTILAIGTFIFGMTFSRVIKQLGNKLNSFTYPELITTRYDNRTGMIVVICCMLAGIGFAASQLVAMYQVLVVMTGWSASSCFLLSTAITIGYTAVGGMLAVSYTTWVQFILIILGVAVLGMPLSAHAIGGFQAVSTLPPEWFDIGRYGWPKIIALCLSSTFAFFTSMDSYTRCFAAKDEKAARNGTLWASLGVLVIAFSATFIGMAAKLLFPELPKGSSVFAEMVMRYFPTGIKGLVLIGILSAIMSTAVVSVVGAATNISVDIYKGNIRKNASDRVVKNLGVLSSFAVGILAALMAWWKQDIIDLLLLAFTFEAAALFVPTVGIFWRKSNSRAAFYSMVASLGAVLLWMIGGGLHWGGIFEIDPLWPGIALSVIVFVSLAVRLKPTPSDEDKAEIFKQPTKHVKKSA